MNPSAPSYVARPADREFLEGIVLGETADQRIVVFLDEIDATLRLPFTDDFFAGIRACYNARATKPAFERLTFALLGVASPDELVKDATRTPFNIGRRIELNDFTLDQAAPLAAGLPLAEAAARHALERVLHWTAGQPYLTQKLCLELSRRLAAETANEAPASAQVDALVEQLLFSPERIRDEVHFKYIRDRVLDDPRRRLVLRTYRHVLMGQPPGDNPQSLAQNALKLAGLVRRAPNGMLTTRNRVYDRIFGRAWVRQVLATDPPRRRAFLVGLASMLLIAAPIAFWLWGSSQEARAGARVEVLLKARPDAVPGALAELQPLQRRAVPLILAAFRNAPDGSPDQLQAALGLAAFGDVRVPFLVESAAQGLPGQSLNVLRALEPQRTAALAEIQNAMPRQPNPDARARLATLALALGDIRPAETLTARNPDPTNRTAFIHGYPHWPADVGQLAELLQTIRTNAGLADLRSALCAALALIEWTSFTSPQQETLRTAMQRLFTESPDGGTHSAAACALTRWGHDPALPESTRQPVLDRDWFVNTQGMTMIRIPAGAFRMGHPADRDDATPHIVTNSQPFFVCDREVNVAQFREFHAAASRPEYQAATERLADWPDYVTQASPLTNCPVQDVSWLDAVKFCNWLSRREDRPVCYVPSNNPQGQAVEWECDWDAAGYRLPTEAEWEYACRAGSESRFAFGDDQRLLGDYAWYRDTSRGGTWPSARKLPNLWGLFDLHGNVGEWCYDWYDGNYYERTASKADPRGPESGTSRVCRGGSWIADNPAHLSCSGSFRWSCLCRRWRGWPSGCCVAGRGSMIINRPPHAPEKPPKRRGAGRGR